MTQSFAPQRASVRRRRAFARRSRSNARPPLVFALAAALAATGARAQEANGNATNEANNPLTAKITVNLQDYYTPSFYGPLNSDATSSQSTAISMICT
jgi:hypothetical protein